MSKAKEFRRRFYRALLSALRVVWPILSIILAFMVSLGLVIAWIEDWSLRDGVYFAFVTGLTVGYGDIVPKQPVGRILAIAIGFHGVLLTALFAAISVNALQKSIPETSDSDRAS
jgi:voltage-gated potassium channel Kch